jgi:hypothetical protein
MNPLAIVALIQALISAGVEAAAAWNSISTIVAQNRDPSAAEWASVGVDADTAHAQVAALR